MIKEYCDRCKGEINPRNKAKEFRLTELSRRRKKRRNVRKGEAGC